MRHKTHVSIRTYIKISPKRAGLIRNNRLRSLRFASDVLIKSPRSIAKTPRSVKLLPLFLYRGAFPLHRERSVVVETKKAADPIEPAARIAVPCEALFAMAFLELALTKN